MPKVTEKAGGWIKQGLNSNCYEQWKNSMIFCKACGKTFKCEKKSHFTQHDTSITHTVNVKKPMRQTSLVNMGQCSQELNKQFNRDLCNAFTAANISWTKLNCPKLRQFLEHYCGRKFPDESTLRKNYLLECYNMTIDFIRESVGNSNIWAAVDETTDRNGRYVANIIVGKLSSTEFSRPFLLASKSLDKTNSTTVARFVNDSLGLLWPSGIHYSRLKLLLTDGAAYMLKCARELKIFYPELIHFTCMAHCLNLVCETIRNNYGNVNGLISYVKKVFVKAPLRVQHYKSTLPNLPLPPEPVLTRWGTWLEAALFYAEHFEDVKQVVCSFEDSAVCVTKAKKYFNNASIKNDLIYIKSHFSILPLSIKKLEKSGLPLFESLEIVQEVEETLKNARGPVADLTYLKLTKTLEKNPGYIILKRISNLFMGNVLEDEIEVADWSVFKYAPVTSCDVERSFSWLKNILTEKRTSFTSENLEKYLICHANAQNEDC